MLKQFAWNAKSERDTGMKISRQRQASTHCNAGPGKKMRSRLRHTMHAAQLSGGGRNVSSRSGKALVRRSDRTAFIPAVFSAEDIGVALSGGTARRVTRSPPGPVSFAILKHVLIARDGFVETRNRTIGRRTAVIVAGAVIRIGCQIARIAGILWQNTASQGGDASNGQNAHASPPTERLCLMRCQFERFVHVFNSALL